MTLEINIANVKQDYEIPKKDWDKILDFLKSSKEDSRLEYVSKLEEAISDHTYEYKELYIYTSNKTYVWPLFEYKGRLLLIPGGNIKYFYRADINLLKYFGNK